jgi:thiol-disulfide isomerase/thioredoxin
VETECAAGKLVVVNFFAPECYACKSMQPKLRQIARDNPDAVFLKVNGLVSEAVVLRCAAAELLS